VEVGVSEENGSSRKIKVVDRRWFTDGGDLREERPVGTARPEPKPEPTPAPEAETQRASEDSQAASQATSQLFLELVATLAQQAELFMVGGQGLPRQPEQARRLVDYLGILETKTRGNLSPEEKQILGNVVFQLRSLYLQAGR
jgi:hypothetical protein